MNPRYRAMILGEELTLVSKLSGAFLRPKSGAHLQFAYFESSLVVEWLIKKWGVEKMRALLGDLARGVEINAALAARFAPIENWTPNLQRTRAASQTPPARSSTGRSPIRSRFAASRS